MEYFEKLVAAMRKAQKAYFMNHDDSLKYGLLKESKDLEKQVDQYLTNKTEPRLL